MPEYIVIVFDRKSNMIVSATIADNLQQAEKIQLDYTNDFSFAAIVPCDYSMRGE